MTWRRLWPLPALVLCLALPWLPGLPPFWITLGNYIGIAAIVAIGLVVLTGVGGITSFGQASFVGFGAYTTAILTTQSGMSPWLTLPASLAASAAAALAIGAITLRLSGHYLAVGTIAWSVSLYYTFANLDLFGRNDGISAIPPLSLGGLTLIDGRRYFSVIWIGVVLAALATGNLLDSRAGRAIRALRGGALAAASFGVNTPRARTLAFVYAAMLAAFAGWLYAHLQRSVNPTPFGLNAGIEYLLMAVVGGTAHIPGALLGAGLVTVVNDLLQDVLPKLVGAQGNFETIVFGAILVMALQASPEGIWPHLARVRPRPHRVRADAAPLPARPMPPRGAPVLEVRGLHRSFGGVVAVNDLFFALAAGEIVGLIGPNGAGKSTTFNLLTGVDRPAAGEVEFLGRPLVGLTAPAIARLGIARSFQHVRLVASMSVIENVVIGAHLRGHAGPLQGVLRLDRAEEAQLYAEAARQLTRVGLTAEADRPATSLALGQQRLVEIARALCLDPVLLLLDEPAAGLRHAEKAGLAALLRRLRGEGVTILLVEHDMEFVMNLTDRLVVMDFGTLLAEGAPAAVRRDPAVIEAYLGSVA
jgi:branched-chain amino acid transport system permease protein